MIRRLPPYWFNKSGKTQRRTVTRDSGGGPIITYADNLTGLRMRFNAKGGTERGSRGRMNTNNSDVVYVNGAPDIVTTDRIVFDSRVFDVTNKQNPDEVGAFLRLEVAEVMPSGVGA